MWIDLTGRVCAANTIASRSGPGPVSRKTLKRAQRRLRVELIRAAANQKKVAPPAEG